MGFPNYPIMSIVDGKLCTTSNKCKTTGSCCATYMDKASGGTTSTLTICWPAGTAKGGSQKAGEALTSPTIASGSDAYAAAECKKAAGASALAVSAAAAATALYAMY